MGYTTDFTGDFNFSRELTPTEKEYINRFSNTRRMKRDVKKLMELYKGEFGYPFPELLDDKSPEAVYGNEGEYFAKNDGNAGQTHDASIIDYNIPAGQQESRDIKYINEVWNENSKRIKKGTCQPDLWCQWNVIQYRDGREVLAWDGTEKFYYYIEWLKYLIAHFFSKWGVLLNGEVKWQGEDPEDMGIIIVENNKVRTRSAEIIFKDDDEDEE